MSASSNFVSSVPLNGNEHFPSLTLWDNVLNYNTFFVQLKTDQPCKITVYQSNDSNPGLNLSVLYEYYYESLTQNVVYEGNINCMNISFILENESSSNQNNLYFSVVYK